MLRLSTHIVRAIRGRLFCLSSQPPKLDGFTKVPELASAAEFQGLTANQAAKGGVDYVAPSKPVCIAFVSWVSAECRRFGPELDEIVARFPSVTFARLDVEGEEAGRLALEAGVTKDTKLPMLRLYKNGMALAPDFHDKAALERGLQNLVKTA